MRGFNIFYNYKTLKFRLIHKNLNFSRIMKQVFLNFSNKKLEEKYQKSRTPIMIGKFYYFYKLEMFFLFFMMIYNMIFEKSNIIRQIISLLGVAILVIFLLLVKKYFVKVFEISIVIIFSLCGIVFVELIHMEMTPDYLFSFTCFALLLPFQLFINLILLSRAGWIYCLGFYVFNIIYLFLRVFNFYDNNIQQILVGSIINIINFAFVSYKQEKTQREYFKKMDDSNENLRQFKFVLQSILPSPLVIINYKEDHLEFTNKSASKLFHKYYNRQNINIIEKKSLKDSYFEESGKLRENTSLPSFEGVLNSHFTIIEQQPFLNGFKGSLAEKLRDFYENEDSDKDNENFQTMHISSYFSPEEHFSSFKTAPDEISLTRNKYFELKITKIQWGDNICLLLVFHDETKAKKLAELIEIDKYKNKILATVSHDLRTPLNGVIGMITTVFSSIDDKECRKNLTVAIRSANLLNFLINDILDFSQISYKKLRLNIEKIKIIDLVSELYSLMKLQARKKNLEFRWKLESKEMEYIYSDPNRIKQILLNLLSNAIKFTSTGSVEFEVKNLDETSNESSIFKFSVKDTGIGIHQEDQNKLFHLFGKLKQEEDEINKTGIGLGLTISQNLAKMLYSGEDSGIHIDSNYGKGSTFWFKIDAGKKDFDDCVFFEEKGLNDSFSTNINMKRYESSSGIPLSKLNSLSSRSRLNSSINLKLYEMKNNLKILIVDDDPVCVMIMEKYLQFFKIEYFIAMNGLEAVGIIEKEVIINNKEISAILMDCNMPIMDGLRQPKRF